MESIYSRNMKFWLLYFVKTTAMVFALITGMVAFMTIMSGEPFLQEFSKNIATYFIMASVLTVMVYGFTCLTVFVPLGVSFGTRRKPSIICMSIAEHIVLLFAFAVSIVLLAIANKDLGPLLLAFLPFVVAFILFIMFLGNLISVFSNRFGRTAGMIVYIFAVFVCSAGLGVLIGARGDVLEILLGLVTFNPVMLGTTVAVVFLGLDVLSVFFMIKGLNKKELSFD